MSQGLLLYAILVASAYEDYVLLLLLLIHDRYRDSQQCKLFIIGYSNGFSLRIMCIIIACYYQVDQ
jgi:hypothetical protein